MAITGIVYRNETMQCEGIFGMCNRAVARIYQPFCHDCYKSAISQGHFRSRYDQKEYRYNGRRWVFVIDPPGSAL